MHRFKHVATSVVTTALVPVVFGLQAAAQIANDVTIAGDGANEAAAGANGGNNGARQGMNVGEYILLGVGIGALGLAIGAVAKVTKALIHKCCPGCWGCMEEKDLNNLIDDIENFLQKSLKFAVKEKYGEEVAKTFTLTEDDSKELREKLEAKDKEGVKTKVKKLLGDIGKITTIDETDGSANNDDIVENLVTTLFDGYNELLISDNAAEAEVANKDGDVAIEMEPFLNSANYAVTIAGDVTTTSDDLDA